MTSPQAISCLAEHLPVRRSSSDQAPERPVAPGAHALHDARPSAGDSHDLTSRIRLLIAQEGSASAIARRCGCSEGAVRSWRDGRSDLSRTRCVAVANALGISLAWLVAGEGPMKPAADAGGTSPAARGTGADEAAPARTSGIDPQRLAAALRLLQSYVCMIGGSLDPEQRADAMAELYQLLGDFGSPQTADRVIAFHGRLAAQLRRRQTTSV